MTIPANRLGTNQDDGDVVVSPSAQCLFYQFLADGIRVTEALDDLQNGLVFQHIREAVRTQEKALSILPAHLSGLGLDFVIPTLAPLGAVG